MWGLQHGDGTVSWSSPKAKSQQLHARRSQEVKSKEVPPLEEHALFSFSPFFLRLFQRTLTQLNPHVSLTLSQPLRGSAHRHQHSARCLSLSLQHDKSWNRITMEKDRLGGWGVGVCWDMDGRKDEKGINTRLKRVLTSEHAIAACTLVTHLHIILFTWLSWCAALPREVGQICMCWCSSEVKYNDLFT